jgi:tetratricopeptide (TPR) repeat protein
MRKIYLIFPLFATLLILIQSCENTGQKQLRKIKSYEDELFGKPAVVIDSEKASALVDLYIKYATAHAENAQVPEFLFRAADLSMNTGNSQRAIDLYSRIHKDYPDFDKRPESLFLTAFIYENQLNNLPKAEQAYKQFIELYPEHDLADDAEILLEHLGKPADELVREFERKLTEQEGL